MESRKSCCKCVNNVGGWDFAQDPETPYTKGRYESPPDSLPLKGGMRNFVVQEGAQGKRRQRRLGRSERGRWRRGKGRVYVVRN